jgi:hypothetical protein
MANAIPIAYQAILLIVPICAKPVQPIVFNALPSVVLPVTRIITY